MKQRRCTPFGAFMWLMIIAGIIRFHHVLLTLVILGFLTAVCALAVTARRESQKDRLDDIMASLKDKGDGK